MWFLGGVATRRPLERAASLAAMGSLVVLGAALRFPGFSSRGLFFDDSWVVVAARAKLTEAAAMGMTTPGYVLALHGWAALHDASTSWLQVPGFALALLGIVGIVLVVRSLGWWWPLAWIAGFFVAVCPTLVTYSMRVKQYSFDLGAAELLLACIGWWWSAPSRARTTALVAVAASATVVSSACWSLDVGLVVVLGVAWAHRRCGWGPLVAMVTTLAVEVTVLELVCLRRIPPSLTTWWSHFGNLLGRPPAQGLARGIEVSLSGFLGGLTGYPTVPLGQSLLRSHRITAPSTAVAATVLVLLCAAGVATVARRRPFAAPVLVALVSLLTTIAASTLGLVPFGGGRTDIVLYPSVLLLACAGAQLVVDKAREPVARPWSGLVVLVLAVGLVAVTVPIRPATYPGNGLARLAAELERRAQPHDVVLVGSFFAYEWSAERLSPTGISFAATERPWLNSFHVVSESPSVVITANSEGPDADLARTLRGVDRLWIVATPLEMLADSTIPYLYRHGYHIAPTTLRATGVDAFLMTTDPVAPTHGGAPRR